MFKKRFKHFSEGTRTFLVIWFGGFISQTGTGMSQFALVTWAYSITEQATTLALLLFSSYVMSTLMSPFSGIVVDRYDRRWVMLIADLLAALITGGVLVLYLGGDLVIWHLYIAQGMTGGLSAFQRPAYTAIISVLVPKQFYTRAGGLRSLAQESSRIAAPFLGGVLLVYAGLASVLIVDLVTFLIAAFLLWIVRVPRPEIDAESNGLSYRQQIIYGFRYIFARRGLMWLMFIFAGVNFFASLTYFGVLSAMVLARSGGNELALAGVNSALGIGGVVGALFVSIWGGPRRKIHGALAFTAVSFLIGDFVIGIGQSPVAWMLGAFLASSLIPPLVASESAIWQSKVPPAVQGKVFAVKMLFREILFPVGFLIAGPLADQVFEPALAVDGVLVETFGGLVGVGAGAGMGLMFVCTAFFGLIISLSGYLNPRVRDVEDDLPDYDEIRVSQVA